MIGVTMNHAIVEYKKRGRKPQPEHLRGKTTSIRLSQERLQKFKLLGGNRWLNQLIDAFNVQA